MWFIYVILSVELCVYLWYGWLGKLCTVVCVCVQCDVACVYVWAWGASLIGGPTALWSWQPAEESFWQSSATPPTYTHTHTHLNTIFSAFNFKSAFLCFSNHSSSIWMKVTIARLFSERSMTVSNVCCRFLSEVFCQGWVHKTIPSFTQGWNLCFLSFYPEMLGK